MSANLSYEKLYNISERLLDSSQKEIGSLKKQLAEALDIIEGKTKTFPNTYNPERFKGVKALILRYATELSLKMINSAKSGLRLSIAWTDQELYDYMKARIPDLKVKFNTVDRSCELLVQEKLLVRTAPATYYVKLGAP